MMIGSLLGADIFSKKTYAGMDLGGDLSTFMTWLSTIALLAFLIGAWLWLWFRPSAARRMDGYKLTCFVLLGAVILSRVLSPQYFIWAVCMSVLVGVEQLPPNGAKPWVLTALWLIIAGLTTWIFPYHYVAAQSVSALALTDPLEARVFHFVPCALLALRNVLYLGLVIWQGVGLFRHNHLR